MIDIAIYHIISNRWPHLESSSIYRPRGASVGVLHFGDVRLFCWGDYVHVKDRDGARWLGRILYGDPDFLVKLEKYLGPPAT